MNAQGYKIKIFTSYHSGYQVRIGGSSGGSGVFTSPIPPGDYDYPFIIRTSDDVTMYRHDIVHGGHVLKRRVDHVDHNGDIRYSIILSPTTKLDYRTLMFTIMGVL